MTFMSPLEESAALAKIARTLAEIHGQALEPKHIMEAIARVRGLRSSPDVAMRIEDMVDNLLTEVWNDWDEKQAMRAAPGTHTTRSFVGPINASSWTAPTTRVDPVPPERMITRTDQIVFGAEPGE